MNPLNTIEKAKKWAEAMAVIYSNGCSFFVCKWNDEYIVQESKFVKEHYKKYDLEEIVFCTDEYVFSQIISLIKLNNI
jgi:hypothetical protein